MCAEQPRSDARSRTLTHTHARVCAQADVKTAKLKKLWTRFQQAKQEVVDVQVGVVAVQHTHTRAHTLTHTHTHAHAHVPLLTTVNFFRFRGVGLDATVRIWELTTGRLVRTLKGVSQHVRVRACWSGSEKYVLSAGETYYIEINVNWIENFVVCACAI